MLLFRSEGCLQPHQIRTLQTPAHAQSLEAMRLIMLCRLPGAPILQLSELPWRHADDLAKATGKMTLICKTHRKCYFG